MTNEMINKWLFRISLAFLAAFATGAQAVAQGVPQGVRGFGPPTVTITSVTDLGGAGQTRNFRVQWTTQKPEFTTIVGYGVTLEVKFTGGVNQSGSQKAPGTANSATISLTVAQANARALEFKAVVNTTFKTRESSSVTTTREFDLATSAAQGGVGSGGSLPADRPVVQISTVNDLDARTFEIRWNVQSAPGVNIERFGASALVAYKTGDARPGGTPPTTTRQTLVSIASGSQRQTRVIVNDVPLAGRAAPLRAKATLETAFNIPVERTIQTNKEGRF